MAERIIEWVADLGPTALYFGTFLLALGETALFADLVVPGEVGMVVAGAAGHDAGISLPLLIVMGSVGATVGDSLSYLFGRYAGLGAVHRWPWLGERLQPKIDQAHEYFGDRGGAAVFWGRFVGALRAVVPAVAGVAGMPYPRFLLWNVMASVAWVTGVTSLGWFLGREIAGAVDRGGFLLTVVVVGGVGAWWLARRRRRGLGEDR